MKNQFLINQLKSAKMVSVSLADSPRSRDASLNYLIGFIEGFLTGKGEMKTEEQASEFIEFREQVETLIRPE